MNNRKQEVDRKYPPSPCFINTKFTEVRGGISGEQSKSDEQPEKQAIRSSDLRVSILNPLPLPLQLGLYSRFLCQATRTVIRGSLGHILSWHHGFGLLPRE